MQKPLLLAAVFLGMEPMMRSASWSPICRGELADELRAAALDIAAALQATPFADPSLTGAGAATVLYGYLADALEEPRFADLSVAMVEDATARMAELPATAALFGGFTGLAWCVEHVLADDEEDANEAVDAALARVLGSSPWPGKLDLIGGLVGIGVYALERLPRAGAIELLGLVVDRLRELAEPRDDGFAWKCEARHLGSLRARHPGGAYDLGVAHGAAGVIALLGRACDVPEVAGRARPLLDGAVEWLLRQRLPAGSSSVFPWFAGEGTATRAAWCHGDPGIAAALLLAARAVGEPSWERAAIEIAMASTALLDLHAGFVDPCLCHGSAGLAHLFNRLHQATGERRFADVARAWFRRTLRYGRPGGSDASFLTGATGVALALLGAVSGVEPNWDRVLLCSIPPCGLRPRPEA